MSDIVHRLLTGTTDGTALTWTVTEIHTEAAREITRMRDALKIIHRTLTPNNRTFDELMRDIMHADDIVRAALTPPKEKADD